MPHYTDDNIPSTLTIAHLVHLLSQYKDRLLEKHLAPFDITGPQYRVLKLIICDGIDTPTALTRLLSIDSGAMTRMLDRLTQRGLLVRERCPEDRRQVRLKPTPEGIDFSRRMYGVATDTLNELTCDLTGAELEELKRLIRKVLAPTGLLDFPNNSGD